MTERKSEILYAQETEKISKFRNKVEGCLLTFYQGVNKKKYSWHHFKEGLAKNVHEAKKEAR